MQIRVEIPDELAIRLSSLQDQLPQILELGLRVQMRKLAPICVGSVRSKINCREKPLKPLEYVHPVCKLHYIGTYQLM